MHNNWKLYAENVRDNYHPSLLHAFFSTFKHGRPKIIARYRQLIFAKNHTDHGAAEYSSGMIRVQKDDFGLKDPF